jgi:hypothetical protein
VTKGPLWTTDVCEWAFAVSEPPNRRYPGHPGRGDLTIASSRAVISQSTEG